ncbi:MAG: small multi-drug export protein [Candidatus Saccharimonadaceae bacterium]|nr:small multi-drug export protein [Candidatus Saccharimonadaceae bacterium]
MFWKVLLVLIISMIPLIELRGAVPIGIGFDFGLEEWQVLIIAIIGNLIPVPFIYFFARKFLEWGSKKKWKPLRQFCNFCLKKGEKAGNKLLKKAGSYGTFFALFLFVAIPIPGTGAWTGTLAASILKLDFKKTMIAIMSGILVAGLIMLAVALGLFKGILGG